MANRQDFKRLEDGGKAKTMIDKAGSINLRISDLNKNLY